MSDRYNSIPEDRRHAYEQRAEAEAHAAALVVAYELQPPANEWYVPPFLKNLAAVEGFLPPKQADNSNLSLQEQLNHQLSQPGDFDLATEAAAELEKRAAVHDWLKRNMGTTDTQEAMYQFMLRKSFSPEDKKRLLSTYQTDPAGFDLSQKYYDQVASIIADEQKPPKQI
jgi:hypothetical protein